MLGQSVQIKKGKELSNIELTLINNARVAHFNSKNTIRPSPENEDWEKLYFLKYTESGELGVFARYHNVLIEFNGKNYEVLGSATLIALIPGKGYGAEVKKEMIRYTMEQGKTSIGFCNPKLSKYYKSLGCGIIIDGARRFYQREQDGNLKQFLIGNDVLYIEGKDQLIQEILKSPDLPVICGRYHW
ncbi:MAG: hypothetical protein WC988_01075 [Patescibacteria group bacterium]